jgi:hypothetical protein
MLSEVAVMLNVTDVLEGVVVILDVCCVPA